MCYPTPPCAAAVGMALPGVVKPACSSTRLVRYGTDIPPAVDQMLWKAQHGRSDQDPV